GRRCGDPRLDGRGGPAARPVGTLPRGGRRRICGRAPGSAEARAGRMRVAFYSPLPPERTGIADYSALLLPPLAERSEVAVAGRARRRRFPEAEVALYHVGNNPDYHGWIVDVLRRRPGVVVLHDFVLHHLVAGITLARGDAVGYLNAMERDAG